MRKRLPIRTRFTGTPPGAAASSGGHRQGRLAARPAPGETATRVPEPGLRHLGISESRDGLLYVPAGYRPDHPARLALMLHGAGADAQQGVSLLRSLADASDLLLLATTSRLSTWDLLAGDYGPDVEIIDHALEQTFSHYAVDPAHVAVGGFSDGASYALSLGISNGDLFTHIIAFSPGFIAPSREEGDPRIFISHGTHDRVLPIDRCSRRIVPALREAGYHVNYIEFDGPHTVPTDIAREAVAWFVV